MYLSVFAHSLHFIHTILPVQAAGIVKYKAMKSGKGLSVQFHILEARDGPFRKAKAHGISN